MIERKKGLTKTQIFFLVLLILSALAFIVLFLGFQLLQLAELYPELFDSMDMTSAVIGSDLNIAVLGTTLGVARFSAIVSFIGLVSATLLSWRREGREARMIDLELRSQKTKLELERDSLEIEKLKLELEKLQIELGRQVDRTGREK